MQQQISLIRSLPEDRGHVPASGRLVAIDPGTKKIGLALTDETRTVIRRLPIIQRSSWKKLLSDVARVLAEYDAAALIVGLPYNTDGTESAMSLEAREMARKFALSLEIPVFLQDERVTTYEARRRLWDEGLKNEELAAVLDSEAAAVILSDFVDRLGQRPTDGA